MSRDLDQQIPTPNPRFQTVEMSGEQLLYDTESQNVLHLDSSAALIWSLCDGKRRVAEVKQLLRDAYPDAADQITKDVDRALAMLAVASTLTLQD